MSKVSVVIPTYESANLLGEAIESALGQTLSDLEVIVVDDGSTDNTEEVVRGIQDSRVRYIYQKNAGTAEARDRGYREAKGDFIALLDADDLWLPQKLEKQLPLFENKKVGLVFSDGYYLKENGDDSEKIGDETVWPRGDILLDILLNNFITTSSVVARAEVIREVGGHSASFEANEDFYLWVKILRKYHADYVDEPLVKYRVLLSSKSHSHLEDGSWISKVLKTRYYVLEEFPDLRGMLGEKGLAGYFKNYYADLARVFIRQGKTREARRYLRRHLSLKPGDGKAKLLYAISFFPNIYRSIVRAKIANN